MAAPTADALLSLLAKCTAPLQVHLFSNGLDETDLGVFRELARRNEAILTVHPVEAMLSAGSGSKKRHVTNTALAKLFMPRVLSGRVLYVDGDVLVDGDIAPLFTLDMRGALIGAVRDSLILKWLARRENPEKRTQRIRDLGSIMGEHPLNEYFNSGVLLLDCDAIKAEPGLCDGLEDLGATTSHWTMDQDHLNAVFAGRVRFLSPDWNHSWRRQNYVRKLWQSVDGQCPAERAIRRPRIVHFTGKRKPWHALGPSILDPRLLVGALWYRRKLRQLKNA